MRSFAIIIAMLMACVSTTFAQTKQAPITLKRTWVEHQFYQGNKKLSMSQVSNLMRSNEQAYKQFQSARAPYIGVWALGVTGGGLIGFPIGKALVGAEPNWIIAGLGAGLLVVAIPVARSYNKKVDQAIDTYNKGLQTSSVWERSELNFAVTRNGVGLTLNF